MYSKTAVLILFLTASVANALELKLNSGKTITVEDDSDITSVQDPLSGSLPLGVISPRQLFGRQTGCYNPNQRIICGGGCCDNDKFCCEGKSCGKPSERLCCQGGHQCYAGGDCCSDGNCCDPGKYCVKNSITGEIGCKSNSGGSSGGTTGSNSGNSDGGTSATRASTSTSASTYTTTSSTTITSAATTSTSTTTRTSTSTTGQVIAAGNPSCKDTGYLLCPDQKFCCPSGSYCYYDTQSAPKCWDRSIYYYYYSYSWSYSFGVRYYTTYTLYDLIAVGTSGSNVPALSTPPPPSTAPESNPNPTSQSTVALTRTTVGSSVGVGGLVGGSAGSSATGSISSSSASPSSASSASTPDATASQASPTPFTPTGNAGATATRSVAVGAASGAEAVISASRLLWLALGSGFAWLLL
ncbi:MAG: hypothetical protein M1836_008173 [Candelina mexicana]|nr:MAG: hypothetical protein M1836_008173 [Candelina mexicana]